MDEDAPKKQRDESPNDEADVRCGCGSLLARRLEEGVEIKCRRCKRVLVIEVSWRGIRMSRE